MEVIATQDYVVVAIITAVGYDYLLTFPQEIEYMWSKPWTWVSMLFILSRYCGLISLITYCLVFWLVDLQTRRSVVQ